MLRAQLAAIRAHEAGVREGADHEELHQMRTAVRRLRAILRVVPAALANEPAANRRELRWLGRARPGRAAGGGGARLIERQRRRRRAAWRAFDEAWPALKRRGRKAWG